MLEKSSEIRDFLVEWGKSIFESPKQVHNFTKSDPANGLLNDLDGFPHAFVLACVMDRQIKAERAWMIPYEISLKIGGFSMDQLRQLSLKRMSGLMLKPKPLHRFAEKMSQYFHTTIHRIEEQYDSDASLIWKGNPSSAEVAYRFLQFEGVGPKIASMATNILARELKVPMSDYYAIDISADVHIRRVFARLGLCPPDSSVEQVVYKAKALYPEFPGIMDLPCWELGRKWCTARNPRCVECRMKDLCPSAEINKE